MSSQPRDGAIPYALETLYEHQDRDWVVDTVPHVLAWVHAGDEQRDPQPFLFNVHVAQPSGAPPDDRVLALSWNVDRLAEHGGDLRGKVERLRSGRSVDRERVTETAAYGLSLVAISVFMPGRRVISMEKFRCPDFLFDATPGAYRGVEVAGRTTGGFAALRAVRFEKTPGLVGKADVAEAHLSLWCAEPRVSELYMVKP